MKISKKTRKASWLYEDLAWKIATPSLACKLILTLLSKQANDAGKSYPSYEYIMACTNINSKTTVITALKYLRDELKILDWVPGGKGRTDDSNRYVLNLSEMKSVIKTQKRFDIESGKYLRPSPMVGLALGLKPSPVSVPGSVKTESSLRKTESSECTVTLYKSNPQQIESIRLGGTKILGGVGGDKSVLARESGAISTDTSTTSGNPSRQPVPGKTQIFPIRVIGGIRHIEGTSYKDAEKKIAAEVEAYQNWKCGE